MSSSYTHCFPLHMSIQKKCMQITEQPPTSRWHPKLHSRNIAHMAHGICVINHPPPASPWPTSDHATRSRGQSTQNSVCMCSTAHGKEVGWGMGRNISTCGVQLGVRPSFHRIPHSRFSRRCLCPPPQESARYSHRHFHTPSAPQRAHPS